MWRIWSIVFLFAVALNIIVSWGFTLWFLLTYQISKQVKRRYETVRINDKGSLSYDAIMLHGKNEMLF